MNKKYYGFHALLINPGINLWAVHYINILEKSQTYVGNTLHHPVYLFAWALSSCIGYYVYSKIIWDQYGIQCNHKLHFLLQAGIVLSVLFPCLESLPGLVNDIHIWMAGICIGGFIFEWIYLGMNSPLQFEKNFKILIGIISICVLTLMSMGHVTAFAEMLFSVSLNVFLYLWMIQNIKKGLHL